MCILRLMVPYLSQLLHGYRSSTLKYRLQTDTSHAQNRLASSTRTVIMSDCKYTPYRTVANTGIRVQSCCTPKWTVETLPHAAVPDLKHGLSDSNLVVLILAVSHMLPNHIITLEVGWQFTMQYILYPKNHLQSIV